MSGEASGWDIAGTIGGIGTLASLLGGGVWKLITRADRRAAAQERKDAALVAKLEARIDALEKEHRDLWIVIGYVVPALHSHDPKSPALRLASQILKDRFPVDLNTPQDMIDTLKKI